jgi:uncharacterized membrane protein YkvA (DUF1232 family)
VKPDRRTIRKAIKLLADGTRTMETVSRSDHKAQANRDLLAGIWDDLASLSRVVRNWGAGTYREVPWRTVVLSAAAILYFVNPLDLVPDVIPLLGFVDDVAIIRGVIAAIRADLSKFRAWEQTQLQPQQAT